MFDDEKVKIFSQAYSHLNLSKIPNAYFNIYNVFKNFIYEPLSKPFKSDYFYYRKKSIFDKKIVKACSKYHLEVEYDEFHDVLNFSFTYKERNKIHFNINCTVIKNEYNIFKVEVSNKYYEKNYLSSYPTPPVFNFLHNFEERKFFNLKNNLVFYYDFSSDDSFHKEYGENIYLELNNEIYIVSEYKNFYNMKNITVCNFYNSNFKIEKIRYQTLGNDFSFDLNYFVNKKSYEPNERMSKSNYFKDISIPLIQVLISNDINIYDISNEHIELAKIFDY